MIVILTAAKMDVGRTPLTEAPPAAVVVSFESMVVVALGSVVVV
eukprot:CAMPEP_0181429958 /NCGR_PEP_ID=MMETSP1110-20121109/17473_1 /TAXON_ID=174948 /ORGANISM="Symbiodinium sp., Strain CCMP421" /LENGTH=43 /DNA_ID= /DNA_START= /DNA_END= /DNA_ORIENTATION=